jgi:hypothetical protein
MGYNVPTKRAAGGWGYTFIFYIYINADAGINIIPVLTSTQVLI